MTTPEVRDPTIPIQVTREFQTFSVYPKDPPGNPGFWDEAMTWETPTYIALANYLEDPGSVFWDVGAWCGPFTLWAKAHGATTWAFEPDPIAYAHLIENLTLDQGDDAGLAFPMMFACGSEAGATVLHADRLGDSRTSQRAKGQGATGGIPIEVPVLRLDDLAPHIGPPDLVKIDCEGMEAEVLAGMMETIVEHRPTIVISLHPGYLYGKDWALIDRVATIYNQAVPARDESLPFIWSPLLPR